MNFTHCSECGLPYQELAWPRSCQCGDMKWQNPIPVVVILQPVVREEENGSHSTGLVIARRAIEPGLGKWSLIAGYMDPDDPSLETAAQREFREETSLELMSRPRMVASATSHRLRVLVTCLIDEPMPYEMFLKGRPCKENFELGVMWDTSFEAKTYDIAFPLHTDMIERWFKNRYT